jgi:NAD+ synthase
LPEQIPITLRVSLDAEEATRVLVRFLKDYTSDVGRSGFVLGISGGIDSAVSCALAVRAVGAKNVHGLVLPDAKTPEKDLDHAAAVAKKFGVRTRAVSIQPMVDAFAHASDAKDRRMLGNIKARCRMILLHAEAARRSSLVLGTGNKSEALIGYMTKFGDAGVDLQPIGDLYKTQVRLLARHLGVPKAVIDKAPTAGLWPGQTDEAEMGVTYEVLDRVLLGLELRLSSAMIASIVGIKPALVQRIEAMRRQSQHKRRMPMVPKIGLRTVGMDWRVATMEQ